MFNWAEWDEGRVILHQWKPKTPATLDHLTTRKLLTAVARNDRFNEGAWAELFEEGVGPLLIARLLEHEEALAGG